MWNIGKKLLSSPFYKKYNGQEWFIKASIINLKRDLNVILTTQNINTLTIFNSIECFVPTLELTYQDLDQFLIKLLDSNDLILRLEIEQMPPSEDEIWSKQKMLNLTTLFNVNKISVIDKKDDNFIYKITASHYNQTWLDKNINYATVKDAYNLSHSGSPLIIINNILGLAGYPKNDCIVNDTQKRIDFISSQTMTVRDSIEQLLRKAVTIHDPPTYFVHNLKSGNAMLINNKTYEQRLANVANVFNVYGKGNEKNLIFNLLTEATNITNDSFTAGFNSQRYLSEFSFRHFDQNTRKWTKTVFNYDIINQLFNGWILKTTNGKYESIFTIPQKVKNNQMKFDFPNYNEQKMYTFLRELQLGINNISFDVAGNITRDAGQYVILNCANEDQMPRYEGLWNVYSCKHIWSGRTYTNHIVCYRTWDICPIWEIKESQQKA